MTSCEKFFYELNMFPSIYKLKNEKIKFKSIYKISLMLHRRKLNFVSKIFFCFSILFICNAKSQTVESPYQVATWSGFRKGALSFTFDDNCANQLSVLMPMFDQYGFKMTFFTVTSWGPNWSALQTAANNGHEIASHTVSHQPLNSLTNDLQTSELKNSQDIINSHIHGQKCLTIAYPNCVEGNPSIISKYYIAARGCSGMIVPKTPPNFMNISSIICGSLGSIKTASDFENKMNAAVSANGWVVFLIHAVDNEPGYSPTSSAQVKGALEYLSKNKDKLWEATFGNVVRYVRERNCINVSEVSSLPDSITLLVADTLDNSIYNYPITLSRPLPQGWDSATVTQNGHMVDVQIVSVDSVNYMMFNVVPDSGNVILAKLETTGIKKYTDLTISTPAVMQNFPNPFNPTTTIEFYLPKSGNINLILIDSIGRVVKTITKGFYSRGNHQVKLDASGLASGVYFYKLQSGGFSIAKKLILSK